VVAKLVGIRGGECGEALTVPDEASTRGLQMELLHYSGVQGADLSARVCLGRCEENCQFFLVPPSGNHAHGILKTGVRSTKKVIRQINCLFSEPERGLKQNTGFCGRYSVFRYVSSIGAECNLSRHSHMSASRSHAPIADLGTGNQGRISSAHELFISPCGNFRILGCNLDSPWELGPWVETYSGESGGTGESQYKDANHGKIERKRARAGHPCP